MLSFIKNKIVKSTSLLIIIVVAFAFIHSELDQFSYDIDHDEHDYCDLVDGATIQLTKTSSGLLKLKIDKISSFNSADIITKSSSFSKKKDFDYYNTSQKFSQLYIFNSTFLI
jgi:hypothetical protein